ncbi:MAG: DUF45 domain-containing protein [Erysipelotrichaceae bacterium]|nr:DUF45 domain-containing protein [Erysipelotrichaceae bacterium]
MEIQWIKKKRNKRMYMRIRNHTLIITTPMHTTKKQVDAFIEKNRRWIETHKDDAPVLIEKGMRVHLLGREVTVEFDAYCHLEENILCLSGDEEQDKAFLLQLLKPYLEQKFHRFRTSMKIEEVQLKYGFYRSKWGSCQPQKKIIRFNGYLVFTDPEIIDAIIVHELAHMRVANHSSNFYAIVLRYQPHYKQIMKRLNTMKIPRFS